MNEVSIRIMLKISQCDYVPWGQNVNGMMALLVRMRLTDIAALTLYWIRQINISQIEDWRLDRQTSKWIKA